MADPQPHEDGPCPIHREQNVPDCATCVLRLRGAMNPEALSIRIDHAHQRIEAHDKRHSGDIGDLRRDVDELKLWRARLEGRLAGFSAAGALIGALVGQLPAFLHWLAR